MNVTSDLEPLVDTLAHDHEHMAARWRDFGARWLRSYPVMAPPPGFELAAELVGPAREGSDTAGWYLEGKEDEEEFIAFHQFADVGPARELVVAIVAAEPRVTRIELWAEGDCIWAARRL
jgi:hypothetical protein